MAVDVERYHKAAGRSAGYLLTQQNSDGSFTGPGFEEDIYHKIAYALGTTGHAVEAHRLIDWVKSNDLRPTGELRHYYSPGRQQVYKDAWIIQGAHRLGRFDVSLPAMAWVASFQAPCGGFKYHSADDDFCQALTTAWAGVAAVYTGRLDIARRAGDAALAMVEQQRDPSRFYYRVTLNGRPVVDYPPGGERGAFVDATKPGQLYFETGILVVFLCHLYRATSEVRYLSVARQVLDFESRCAADAYCSTPSGKSAVGAALYASITGDERSRSAACRFGDYLIETQSTDGTWHLPGDDTRINRLDTAGEFTVWLSEIAAALGGSSADAERPVHSDA